MAIEIQRILAFYLFELQRPGEGRPYAEAVIAALRAVGGPADINAAEDDAGLAIDLFVANLMPFAETRERLIYDRALLAGRTVVSKKELAFIDADLG
jgi:hypothetical protein